VVVKVGSSSITDARGDISSVALESLVEQLAALAAAGHRPLLVSSGAIAAGRRALGNVDGRDIDVLQGLAAVGQGLLMAEYTRRFSALTVLAAQVLLTARDFGERAAYLNARRTLDRLLQWHVIPVINENDTVATDEITFGDNDRLAALVATLVGADLLLLLTDTAGVYSADPRLFAEASLVEEVTRFDASLEAAANGAPGSALGSGGMASKIAAARMAAWSGVPCVIAAAGRPGVIADAVAGAPVGTRVHARPRRMPARKVWIAFTQVPRGRLTIDGGAVDAICNRGRSLLPVGVTSVAGDFGGGEAVEIVGGDGELVAKGLASLPATGLRETLESRDGRRPATAPAVHRDDLVVLAGV
jgi:glutamate 5-kinase